MRIQALVEGHAEVEAVPVLLRRLIAEAGLHNLSVNAPIRCHRSQLVQEVSLKRKVRLAAIQPDCAGILVIFDADGDCPLEIVPNILRWAGEEAGHKPCSVVVANQEYEAWFLASMTSLRGRRGIRQDALAPGRPECIRSAKEHVTNLMESGLCYSERLDQPALSQVFDMRLAYQHSRSFRKMTKAFGDLASSMGAPLAVWPPQSWIGNV